VIINKVETKVRKIKKRDISKKEMNMTGKMTVRNVARMRDKKMEIHTNK